MSFVFIGMSVKGPLTADDRFELRKANIATLLTDDGTWFVYPVNKIQPVQALSVEGDEPVEFDAVASGLFAHDYHRHINQLKRVKSHIYAAYNNDFGIHEKSGTLVD